MSVSRRLLTLAVSAGLALGACTAGATPSPSPTSAPSAGATTTADGTLPKPELSEVKMGTPIGEPSQFSATYAQLAGIYEKYGVKVDIVRFNAGGDAVSALLSGAVDVGNSIGSDFGLTSQLTDVPAYAVSVYKSRVFDGLFCQKDVKTAADLKGKSIGVSSLGATAHASGLLALKGLKLTDKDVTFTPIGNNSARIAALKGGSVACAPISMDQRKAMDDLGLNLLIDLSLDPTLAYPAVGLGVRAEWHKKYPNTTLVLAAAILEAQNMMINDPDTAAKEWAKFAQVDEAKALTDMKAVVPQINKSMTWDDSAFAFTQQVFAIVSPSVMLADPAKASDHSVLQKLMDIGFYKAHNIPTTG